MWLAARLSVLSLYRVEVATAGRYNRLEPADDFIDVATIREHSFIQYTHYIALGAARRI